MAVDTIKSVALTPRAPTATAGSPPPLEARPAALMGADALQITRKTLEMPGLAAGRKYGVEGKYKGYGFGGSSMINAYDGDKLDIQVNASALLFIKVKVHMKFEAQPDGTVMFLAERVDHGKKDPNTPDKVGSKLKVLTSKPGLTVLTTPGGDQVKLQATPQGGMTVSYGAYRITLKP